MLHMPEARRFIGLWLREVKDSDLCALLFGMGNRERSAAIRQSVRQAYKMPAKIRVTAAGSSIESGPVQLSAGGVSYPAMTARADIPCPVRE